MMNLRCLSIISKPSILQILALNWLKLVTEYHTRMWLQKLSHSFQLKYFQLHRNLFSMKEKEDIVFKQSLKALKKHGNFPIWFIWGIEDNVYEFQIFVEFLQRYKSELKISDHASELILESFDEISLCFKFLYSGYYHTSWMHLRRFVEKNIEWLYYHKNPKAEKQIKNRIKDIFTNWEVGYLQDILPKWCVSDELLYDGVFRYLSNQYTHNGKCDIHLEFHKDKFEEWIMLIILCLTLISRLINVSIWDTMEPYLKNTIQSPVIPDEKPWYFSYIQWLWGHWFFSTPETFLYNFVHDSKVGKRLIVDKMWLNLKELFTEENLMDYPL